MPTDPDLHPADFHLLSSLAAAIRISMKMPPGHQLLPWHARIFR